MKTRSEITYTGGLIVHDPVVQVWEDFHTERSGYYRAFWCADPEAHTGSPVIGYCSPGGSQRTIRACAEEVRRLYPDAEIYRHGKAVA